MCVNLRVKLFIFMKPRIIALDYGKRRIGAAVTDALGITAQPLPTMIVKDTEDAIKQVGQLVSKYDSVHIVLGLPLGLSGEVGTAGKEVKEFGSLLCKRLRVRVEYYDERLTSKQAERVIRDLGEKPSRNKKKVDSLSAVFILQDFLELNSTLKNSV